MIRYIVSIRNPASHYFDITMEIKNVVSDNLHFSMPVWTPGSYLVREFGRNVLDFQAADATTGIRLDSKKISKSTWVVHTAGATNLLVRYKVYALEYTVDTSYLDDLHAVINGASVFMYVEGHEYEDILVSVDKIDYWKEISTGLELVESEKSFPTFYAPDYDTLIDSPIEVGNQNVYSFRVGGVEHKISLYSKRIFDHSNLVSDIQKIVESTIAVTGHVPYKQYTFLIDFTDEKYGGLEHLNSTHCMASFFKLEPLQEYKQLLSLFSHEFFHAWNVKRMRPEGLGPFNYSGETYTKSLWVAEGITSYYDDLLLRRAGIYTVSEYLDTLCSNLNLMTSFDGSKWQSAEESSFDAWIKHYRQNENSLNALCSYYTQGAVIGWMLDLEIIRRTKSLKKLDDVIRLVYERTYLTENRSYRDDEFQAACNEVAGGDVTSEIYETRVRGRESIDFQRYLGYAGLKLVPKSKPAEQGFLGVRIKNELGRMIVANTLSASPAEQAGLCAGDEIVGIDGLRTDNARFGIYVTTRKPGTRVALLSARDGSIRENTVEVAAKPSFEYRALKSETATQEEMSVFKTWLNADWNDEIKYEDYAPSPLRRQIFDFI